MGSHWVGTGKRPGARSHIFSGPVPPPVQWDGMGRRGRVFWAWAPCSPPTLSLESGAQVALGGQTGKSITVRPEAAHKEGKAPGALPGEPLILALGWDPTWGPRSWGARV